MLPNRIRWGKDLYQCMYKVYGVFLLNQGHQVLLKTAPHAL